MLLLHPYKERVTMREKKITNKEEEELEKEKKY